MGRESAQDKVWEKRLRAVGLAVQELEQWVVGEAGRTPVLRSIRAQLDADGGTSVLLVLKGEGEGGKRIAFVGGLDLSTVLLSAVKRLRADVMRWREDIPYGER